MATKEIIKPGDKVSFTITKQKGTGFDISSKSGQLVSTNSSNGYSVVKYRNGKETLVPTKSLRLEGQKSELTEAFLKMGKS